MEDRDYLAFIGSGWRMVEEESSYILNELNAELSEPHPLFEKAQHAIAKCNFSDDVLFLLTTGNWAIVHLTYSRHNTDGFPMVTLFADLSSVIRYINEDGVMSRWE